MVDKNLFPYDLAVVAILKNEGPYLKEWLDYHLLAGVDHFYLYDNESTDNQAEVAKPYIEAGIVDYFPAPGKMMQMAVYNDAVNSFKYICRYMAFIDADEFIFPKTNRSIIDVVDEILSQDPKAAGLAIHWHIFGSNGQEKTDYSRGVLERFVKRASNDFSVNRLVKNVVKSAKIKFCNNPHIIDYLKGFHGVDENLNSILAETGNPNPVVTERIVINHYYTKSKEEYEKIKITRGSATQPKNDHKNLEAFKKHDRNEEFDDGILKYRDERAKIYQPPNKAEMEERVLNALKENLAPVSLTNTPQEFYEGKMETFLTCRAVSSWLKEKLEDNLSTILFEEASLKAIIKTLSTQTIEVDNKLFIRELPELLRLPYPAVKELREVFPNIISKMMEKARLSNNLKEYIKLSYLKDFLEIEE